MSAARKFAPCLEFLFCLAMAGLFLAAAVPKIHCPDDFAKVIHAYRMVPDAAVNLLAIFLPWVEAAAALALLGAVRWRRAGLLLCLSMLSVFTAAQAINIFRGVKGACGCFGGGKEIGWAGVAMNAGFLVLGAAAWILQRRRGPPAPSP